MTKLVWDQVGERIYETGVDRGVLYTSGGAGVSWNGLISINETPSGGESKPYYYDGYKYLNNSSVEEYEASIEAYTYPDEFEACNGTPSIRYGLSISQQRRVSFGLCYRTRIGNDVDADNHGYKLHLVYNALAAPTDKGYGSVNSTPSALAFSWKITTKPILVQGYRALSHMIVDTTKVTPTLLTDLENILYGLGDVNPRLPPPNEIVTMFTGWPTLQVVDNGDGTFTAYGPDDAVRMLNANTFQISSDTVVINSDGSFDVTSF